jgi:hypothetical protein
VTAAGAEVGLAFLLSAPRGGRQGVHFSGGRGRDPADNVGEVGIRIKSPAAGAGGDGVEDGEGFSVQTLVMTVSCWIADREIVFKRQSFPRSTPGFWDWLGFQGDCCGRISQFFENHGLLPLRWRAVP